MDVLKQISRSLLVLHPARVVLLLLLFASESFGDGILLRRELLSPKVIKVKGRAGSAARAQGVRRHSASTAASSTNAQEPGASTETQWRELPRLAWVVSQSPDRLGNWSAALSALNCYCVRHGVPLFLETETFINDGRPWLYERLRIVQKYLPYFQWVLHSDLDVLPVNYTVRVTDFLDDGFDLILQDRIPPKAPPTTVLLGTPELHASAYFVKNSEAGQSFMQHWASSSDNRQWRFYNKDNGELHESILHFLGAPSCVTTKSFDGFGFVHPYVTFLHCFRTQWQRYITVNDAGLPWYEVRSSDGFGIKVYRQLAGFHRDSHAADPCLVINPACKFLPGDFLLHGKHLQQFISPHLVDCSAEVHSARGTRDNAASAKDLNSGAGLLHGVKQGAWLSLEQARDAVTWTNLTTYSGCWEGGQNVCMGRIVLHADTIYPFPNF
ncbi:g5487 [Coccomyxa elongata]